MKNLLVIILCVLINLINNNTFANTAPIVTLPLLTTCPLKVYCGKEGDLSSCFPAYDDAGGYLIKGESGSSIQGIYSFYSAEIKHGTPTERAYCIYGINDPVNPGRIKKITFRNRYSVNFEAFFEPGNSWVGAELRDHTCNSTSPVLCPFREPAELYIKPQSSDDKHPFILKGEINGHLVGERVDYFLLDDNVQIFCDGQAECGIDVSAGIILHGDVYYYNLGTIYFDAANWMRITRVEHSGNITPYIIQKHPTLNTVVIARKDRN